MQHTHRRMEELQGEVIKFLDTKPVGIRELPDSTPERTHHQVVPTIPVPHRIGLICGDVLQNLRSTLDYLVYELVAINGKKPNRKHMFPIAMDAERYYRDVEMNHKIKGVHPKAAVFIEVLQPFLLATPETSALYILDELTNLNKHRQPILTAIQGTMEPLLYDFPHLPMLITARASSGEPIQNHMVKLWVGMSDEPVVNFEVCSLMGMLYDYVDAKVLPLFEPFFR